MRKERKWHKMTKIDAVKITSSDKKRYPLPEARDFIILKKIKYLETKKLNKQDKDLIKLIRSQLLKEWRNSLLISLNKLMKKYN
jgi:hypothetical protein